jgi:hypothetical protein
MSIEVCGCVKCGTCMALGSRQPAASSDAKHSGDWLKLCCIPPKGIIWNDMNMQSGGVWLAVEMNAKHAKQGVKSTLSANHAQTKLLTEAPAGA